MASNVRLGALIIKETLVVWRDKKSRLILIVPPIIQLLIFSFAATMDVNNAALGIWNQDRGAAATELTNRLGQLPTFTKIIILNSLAELNEKMDNREILTAIHISSDFTARITNGQPAEVMAILDGRSVNAAQIVSGYLQEIIVSYNRDLSRGLVANIRGQQPSSGLAPTLITRHWFNPNLDYKWFTVPSLVAILVALVVLLITALSIAREREMGTFDQLLVSPLNSWEILLGKTLPAMFFGISEGFLIIACGILLFDLPFSGSLLMLLFSMLIYVLSIVGVGLFVSALSRTQQQGILGAFLFFAPAILLSGFSAPVENMPYWLQTMTLANPLRHFMVVLKGIFLKDMSLWAVWDNTWPLLLIASVTLSLAVWLFRKRLG